jgi:hypothetical protein
MHRYTALALVSVAVLLAMGLWFGVSAVAPQIRAEWGLDESATAWLTLAVQLGFVAGTLISATLNLPDVLRTRTARGRSSSSAAGASRRSRWRTTARLGMRCSLQER